MKLMTPSATRDRSLNNALRRVYSSDVSFEIRRRRIDCKEPTDRPTRAEFHAPSDPPIGESLRMIL